MWRFSILAMSVIRKCRTAWIPKILIASVRSYFQQPWLDFRMNNQLDNHPEKKTGWRSQASSGRFNSLTYCKMVKTKEKQTKKKILKASASCDSLLCDRSQLRFNLLIGTSAHHFHIEFRIKSFQPTICALFRARERLHSIGALAYSKLCDKTAAADKKKPSAFKSVLFVSSLTAWLLSQN